MRIVRDEAGQEIRRENVTQRPEVQAPRDEHGAVITPSKPEAAKPKKKE